MRNSLFTILYLLFLSSCVGDSSIREADEVIDSMVVDTVITDKGSTLSDQVNEDSEPGSKSMFDKDSIENNANDIVKANSESKKEQPISLSKNEIVQLGNRESKPPKVTKEIVWTEEGVKINYSKKVYPDPNIGCSESYEELTIIIPVSNKQDSIKIEGSELKNSVLTYSYSGGLYGESAKGKPLNGIIKLKKEGPEEWNVDLDIQFTVEVLGEMNNKEEVKSFKLSEVFK